MITVQIASIPDRERLLFKTVESLYNQCDVINIFLNGYDSIPEGLKRDRINCLILDNSTGDAAKFYGVENLKGYIFTCDDDIIYPPTYVADTIEAIKKNKALVTYHGKLFLDKPTTDYYNGGQKKYSFLKELKIDTVVDVCGTGVSAFHSDFLKVRYSDFHIRNMTDIHLSKLCKEQAVKIVCLKHRENYFKYQNPKTTIWNEYKDNCKPQTDLLNSFL